MKMTANDYRLHLPAARRPWLMPVLVALVLGGCGRTQAPAAPTNEILWDTWGVPHIFAATAADAAYLLGWAQAHAHANTLAVALGRSTARAAEHWGENFLDDDLMVVALDLAALGDRLYAQLPAGDRERVAAFARGINEYVARHPDALAAANRWVFPIEPAAIVTYNAYLMGGFLYFADDQPAIAQYIERSGEAAAARGSNGYAIGPGKSTSGNALLGINPHLPWSGELMYFESHLVVGSIDAYGASLIGQPHLAVGFTPALGWTHTVNPVDAADTYELTLRGDGYVLDGKVTAFERKPDVVLKIRSSEGEVVEHPVERLSSVHGPVIFKDAARGKALALRFSGLDARAIERFWALLEAQNLEQFEAVTNRHPLPFFNTVYADRDGNILFQYNAALPDRKTANVATWRGLVPGDRSEYLWSSTLPITVMPRIVNPPGGFLQSSNDPPWSATYPFVLDPQQFSPYLPPPAMDFRTQTITKRLIDEPKLSFEELVRQKQSNRVEMADRFVPDLLEASAASKNKRVSDARRVLETWDRHVNPDSRGAVLFLEWVDAMGSTDGDWFATSWSAAEPLTTPRGLKSPRDAVAALERAAQEVQQRFGTLDVPFGEVYRMRIGKKDVPARVASVYYGMAPDGSYHRGEDGRYEIDSGDSFIAIVEYSKPLRAEGLLPYGNSSQPGSPHAGDQLELFSRGELRPLWRTHQEIEQHLERRESPLTTVGR
jgi:acyl-homoserine-lactone acylase